MSRDDPKALAGPRRGTSRRRLAADADAPARAAVLAAQVALVRVQTELRQVELARRQGTLVDRASAEALHEAHGQALRTFWTKWPARAAPELAGAFGLDGDAVADVLARLVRTALTELAHAARQPRRRR